MATESQEELDRRIKELERERREEELRQLKANARIKWVTPAALAALLPIAAGFGLWFLGEVKQYNEAYRALKQRDQLQSEKESLQRQKDSLNIEIATLLQLKEHYADQATQLRLEVESKQAMMDKTYLRAVFAGSEIVYALDHLKGMPPGPDRKGLDEIKRDLSHLPEESAARMESILARYDIMATIIDASLEQARLFQQALKLVPASDWTRELQPMPAGAVVPNRHIMVSESTVGSRYFDVTEGRFLTKEEAEAAR